MCLRVMHACMQDGPQNSQCPLSDGNAHESYSSYQHLLFRIDNTRVCSQACTTPRPFAPIMAQAKTTTLACLLFFVLENRNIVFQSFSCVCARAKQNEYHNVSLTYLVWGMCHTISLLLLLLLFTP